MSGQSRQSRKKFMQAPLPHGESGAHTTAKSLGYYVDRTPLRGGVSPEAEEYLLVMTGRLYSFTRSGGGDGYSVCCGQSQSLFQCVIFK